MKEYLVDVPVKINVWIRPECQKKQFDIIREARPSILFIVSDNGRNEKERKLISQNREIVENIDWECTVYKLYEEENQGMYAMGKKTHELVWSHVDRCIFLEDDILPSISYFRYCAELLEKYKDDKRINVICGVNHLGVSESVNSDYFFSRQGSIWGYATWKRTYEQYSDFSFAKDPYVMDLLKQRTKHNRIFWKRIEAYSKQKYYEGHAAWSEFFFEFAMYGHNQLQIVPKKNMLANIGCSKDAAHSGVLEQLPRGLRRVFNMETYELDFPLKHAQYVIPDVQYEKKRNRIMGYNFPFVSGYRKVETFFLKLRHGEFKEIVTRIYDKVQKCRGIEKIER